MPDEPNVLFICTDQHRLEAVGCYADTVCQTPTIDRLAEEGVRFENAYTTSPMCSPARASLVTGQFPHAHGVTDNVANLGCSVHTLQDRSDLLSRRIEQAGYTPAYNGKWHLCPESDVVFGNEIDPHVPSDVGFEGYDFPGHGDGGWHYPEYDSYLEANGYELDIDELEESYPSGRAGTIEETEATVPYFLAERTISLLGELRERDEPFFLWHNFWGPHEPYYPSEEYYELYEDVEIPPWPNADWPGTNIPGSHHCRLAPEEATAPWEQWAEVIRHYYAFTTMIDSQIGRMLEYLESSGLLDETIVVFTADHGETLGSHGGLSDKGFHHFEEIMHVPLVMRFPDGQWANTTRGELVSLVDLYPTFLDVADSTADLEDRHGRSLLDLFEGDGEDWRDAVCMEFHGLGGVAHTQRTIRQGDLKYGFNAGFEDELYDLAADPNETQNLVDHPNYQDDLERIRDRLAEWQAETDDPLG